MSGKVKMRCGRCGKSFKSSGAKQIYCPECAAKERAARQAQKSAPTTTGATSATAVAAPKIVGPGATILGAAPTIATDVPPDTGLFGAAARASERGHERAAPGGHGVGSAHAEGHPQAHSPGAARESEHGKQPATVGGKHAQHGQHGPRAQTPRAPDSPQQRKPREPRPAPFVLTDEMRQNIEMRYLELAHPVEFDGIRTQIAQELSLPKGAVKRAVADLRVRMQLPSWWELQAYHGSEGDLERIRAAYLPLLPIPPVGVHKRLAEELGLDQITVYQGIRRIRAEMHLPQYNPPEAHTEPTEHTEQAEQATAHHAASAAGSASSATGAPPSGAASLG